MARQLQATSDRIYPSSLSILAPWRICRRGGETRFAIVGENCEVDLNLSSQIRLALRWFEEVDASASIVVFAIRQGVTRQGVGQVRRLAWFDPNLIDQVVAGRQPERLPVDRIVKSPHHDLRSNKRGLTARL